MNKLEQEFLNSKMETETRDWRQSLAIEKFEYKKEQDRKRELEKMQEYNAKIKAQNTKIIIQIITIIFKVCCGIIILPILAIGFFFIGFLKAVMK